MIQVCEACRSGDETVSCMREDPRFHGECPVADQAPPLWPENQLAAELFSQVQGSAQQVTAEDKTYIYIRIADAEALMRMREVPREDREALLSKLLVLQGIANRLRPLHPRKNIPINRRLGRA